MNGVYGTRNSNVLFIKQFVFLSVFYSFFKLFTLISIYRPLKFMDVSVLGCSVPLKMINVSGFGISAPSIIVNVSGLKLRSLEK